MMGDSIENRSKVSDCIKTHLETSNVCATFEEMCDKILSTHMSQQEKKDFLTLQTYEERIAKVSTYTTQIKFSPSSAATEKCEVAANKAREKGNEYFKYKKYHESLISYTQCIALAPAKCDSNSLAIAYANRSAVLKILGLFQACVCDIQRALMHGYPEYLCYKIMQRQRYCYIQMGMKEEAVSMLSKTVEMIDRADISDRQKQQLKYEVTTELKCTGVKQAVSTCEFVPAPHPPELSYGVNEEIPVMTSCVSLRYNKSRGRHLVATRNIQPGDVLGVEPPYSSVLMSENRFTHCSHCLQRSHCLLPCPNCALAMYCQKSCQIDAWQSYHEVECPAMRNIEKLNLRTQVPVHLAVRSIALTGLEQSLKFHRNSCTNPISMKSEAQRTRAFNSSGKFISSDFSVIYHQCNDINSSMLDRILLADFVVKILQYNKHPHAAEITGLILQLICGHSINCHEIYEQYSRCGTSEGDCAVGNGVYPALGLINHSCDQNVVRHYYGKTTVLRAIRLIQKGEEIVDTYGPHFIADSKQERQKMLKLHQYFDCACEACVNNWQTQENLPWSLPMPQGRNKRLLLESSCKVNDSITNYIKNKTVVFDDVPMLCQHLALLDKLNRRMTQEYFVLQEIIKVSYATKTNLYICKQ